MMCDLCPHSGVRWTLAYVGRVGEWLPTLAVYVGRLAHSVGMSVCGRVGHVDVYLHCAIRWDEWHSVWRGPHVECCLHRVAW